MLDFARFFEDFGDFHGFQLFDTPDPEYNLQNVSRSHLYEPPGPDLHCEICKTYLCKTCERTHLADESKEHKVVSFKLRGQSTLCKNIFNHVSVTVKNATFLFAIYVPF